MVCPGRVATQEGLPMLRVKMRTFRPVCGTPLDPTMVLKYGSRKIQETITAPGPMGTDVEPRSIKRWL